MVLFQNCSFQWVLPEIIPQAILTILLLLTGHWFVFLIYGLCTVWIIYRLVHLFMLLWDLFNTCFALLLEVKITQIWIQWNIFYCTHVSILCSGHMACSNIHIVLLYKPRINIFTVLFVFRYMTKPTGNIGLYDPTEIHNRQQLKFHMKENLCKMGFHLVFFFVFLYL